jgi:DDT domain
VVRYLSMALKRQLARQVNSCTDGERPAAGDAVAAYHVLRAFSWQLRLAPFPLADWCAALAAPQPSPLLDEAHLALVRLLAQDESKVPKNAMFVLLWKARVGKEPLKECFRPGVGLTVFLAGQSCWLHGQLAWGSTASTCRVLA